MFDLDLAVVAHQRLAADAAALDQRNRFARRTCGDPCAVQRNGLQGFEMGVVVGIHAKHLNENDSQ